VRGRVSYKYKQAKRRTKRWELGTLWDEVRVQTAGFIVPASKGRIVGERCIGGDEVVEGHTCECMSASKNGILGRVSRRMRFVPAGDIGSIRRCEKRNSVLYKGE